MKLDKFMDNIDFIFCSQEMHKDSKKLFIEAVHQGISYFHSTDELNKISEGLADAINIAPLPLLAKNVGNGIELYYRSNYLLNFEYDTTYETWGIYLEQESVDREGLVSIPVIFMLFYNTIIENIDKYSDYDKVDGDAEET